MNPFERPCASGNALPPGRMPATERRQELCRILAVGLIRLWQRENLQYSQYLGDDALYNAPVQSGHAASEIGENDDEA